MAEYVSDSEGEVGLTEVITLINRLQDVASASNIPPTILDLPQMAVVGEQSAGKSSVLETIVGKDFLPRGVGMVTRCPIVLQLIHHTGEEYAEFLHMKDKKFTRFDDVKNEILLETERQAGKKKGICNKPINIKIYSPDVPHLTLVDLPGLTKIAIDDQPTNIEQVIRDMILNYIQPENTIILAVTQATQDLANSDAIKLAQFVDPKGTRTIGIITKLDMMDAGTDARDILENRVIPLKRGYVGLVNRNQEEIEKRKDIKSAREKEKRFFNTHKSYREIAPRMGSGFLTTMLSEQLCAHIRDKLPSMRTQVHKEHNRVKQTLEAMDAFEQKKDNNWQKPKIIELIQKFAKEFGNSLEGQSMDVDNSGVSGGAKLNDCFYTQVYPLLNVQLVTSKQELTTLWKNMVGYKSIMFFTQDAFNHVIKKHLLQYKDRLTTATDLCKKIVYSTVEACLFKVQAYPALKEEVLRLMTLELNKNEDLTKEQLIFHIKAQKSFMNIYHPDFMKQPDLKEGSKQAQSAKPQQQPNLYRATSQSSSLIDEDDSSHEEDFITRRNEVIRGFATVHSAMPMAKSFLFVLTIEKLVWYKDDYDSRPRGAIPIDKLAVTACRGRGRTKRYCIHNSSRNADSSRMLISFKKESEEKEWMDSFTRVGVRISTEDGTSVDDRSSTSDRNSTSQNQQQQQQENVGNGPPEEEEVAEDFDNDPRHNFDNDPVLEGVIQKLISYAKILDESIHDITPKYICYFLIHKTLKYANLKLLSDIQTENCTELLRVSDEEMNKLDDYFKLYDATTHALKIMGEVSSGSVKQKKKIVKKKKEPENPNHEDVMANENGI